MAKQSAATAPKSRHNASEQAQTRRKGKPRGKSFEPGNEHGKEYRFPPGESGNPGGRPRLLSDAYRAQLAKPVPNDPEGRTYAEAIASAMSVESLKGNVPAAREVRSATEGERIRTWRDDVIDMLRAGTLTPEQVHQELGEDLATELTLAAGLRRGEGGETQAAGEASD